MLIDGKSFLFDVLIKNKEGYENILEMSKNYWQFIGL